LIPADVSGLSTGLLAALSMQRDGFLRERVTAELSKRGERIALAAVFNRVADPVPEIASRAYEALSRMLLPERLPQVVWCLPLIDRVASTPRGEESQVKIRLADFLRGNLEAAAAELDEALGSSDPHLRLSVYAHLARSFPERVSSRLARALSDRSPAVRSWAGLGALSSAKAQLDTLLPLLASNRSPALRLLALREYRRRGDTHGIRAACLDGNANVRFYARRYLKKLQVEIDHRETALTVLNHRESPTSRVVGALALLSELGRERDRALIASFEDDKRASVAAEARRTLRLLG
jgi:HEAT repeat protein